ncbi:uncharacterized LOC103315160 precursor [Tribolium castaneum]|uniref:CCHamide 1 n=1 Tax=Tribolium castaneum TaxID=7070 RepID=S4S925_TRICA|nr:uncharacterized LOC103315160 precursor [Tribolium castaneum]AFJ23969.1 CCHamide 1 precursor [Tribolium castaneum]KYB29079.1 hypothetical protein TcasGA2_TC000813 [Tribolium castaneum]|eukprot:NP_001280542.1 uncharacterized LOC103315160 precursor [Tribolium castaneum]
MCHKQMTMSPLPIKLAKITVIVIFFCFAECAAGSCLSYGHACWGAHGKRNGHVPVREPSRDSGWFLSRLVQSPLYANEEAPSQQLFSDAQMEADPLKGQDDFRSMVDVYPNEENNFFDETFPNQRPRSHKNRVSKLLKRSARMI